MSPFKPQKPSEAEAVRLGLLPRVIHSVSDSKYVEVINQKAAPRGAMQKGPRTGRTQGTLTRLRVLEPGWQGGLGREHLGHLLQAPHVDFTDPSHTSTPITCEVSEAPSSHRTTWSHLASLRSCPSKLLHCFMCSWVCQWLSLPHHLWECAGDNQMGKPWDPSQPQENLWAWGES